MNRRILFSILIGPCDSPHLLKSYDVWGTDPNLSYCSLTVFHSSCQISFTQMTCYVTFASYRAPGAIRDGKMCDGREYNISVLLHSLAKLCVSPKKLSFCSQSFRVLLRNLAFADKTFALSNKKPLRSLVKFLCYPEKLCICWPNVSHSL